MRLEQFTNWIIIIGLTVISGYNDAKGFIHASKIWNKKGIVWEEVVYSGLGFAIGILTYWLSIKFLKVAGVDSVELQTVFWFAVTIISVAVLSGQFISWRLTEQLISIGVLLGIGWLLFRIR